jgi:hypothetical protein
MEELQHDGSAPPGESYISVPKQYSSPLCLLSPSTSGKEQIHTTNQNNRRRPSCLFFCLRCIINANIFELKNVFKPGYASSSPCSGGSKIAVPKQNKQPFMSVLSLSSLVEECKKRIYATHQNHIPKFHVSSPRLSPQRLLPCAQGPRE